MSATFRTISLCLSRTSLVSAGRRQDRTATALSGSHSGLDRSRGSVPIGRPSVSTSGPSCTEGSAEPARRVAGPEGCATVTAGERCSHRSTSAGPLLRAQAATTPCLRRGAPVVDALRLAAGQPLRPRQGRQGCEGHRQLPALEASLSRAASHGRQGTGAALPVAVRRRGDVLLRQLGGRTQCYDSRSQGSSRGLG